MNTPGQPGPGSIGIMPTSVDDRLPGWIGSVFRRVGEAPTTAAQCTAAGTDELQRARRHLRHRPTAESVCEIPRPLRPESSGGFRAINSILRRSLMGRQREYAVFGCSRSAEILSRPKLATCERLLSLSLTFTSA